MANYMQARDFIEPIQGVYAQIEAYVEEVKLDERKRSQAIDFLLNRVCGSSPASPFEETGKERKIVKDTEQLTQGERDKVKRVVRKKIEYLFLYNQVNDLVASLGVPSLVIEQLLEDLVRHESSRKLLHLGVVSLEEIFLLSVQREDYQQVIRFFYDVWKEGFLGDLASKHKEEITLLYDWGFSQEEVQQFLKLLGSGGVAMEPILLLAEQLPGEEVVKRIGELTAVGFDFSQYGGYLPLLANIWREGVGSLEELQEMVPSMFGGECLWPKEVEIDRARLQSLGEPSFLLEAMKGAESLFEMLSNEEREEVASKVSRIACKEGTSEKIGRLVGLVKSEGHLPEFWSHEIFQEKDVDAYVLLAHLMGLISQEELATLHLMISTLRYSSSQGFPILTLPLFRLDGSIHPIAWAFVGATQGMEEENKRREWFRKMAARSQVEHYFLYHPKEKELTVMKVITNPKSVNLNILYNTSSEAPTQCHLVPTLGGALEMVRAVGGEYCPEPAWHYGMSFTEKMREEHLSEPTRKRSVALQSSFYPTPEKADGLYAPGGEVTLHDLLYHFPVLSWIPQAHLHFFMNWAAALSAASGNLDEDLKALVKAFSDEVIDAEYVAYRYQRKHPFKKTVKLMMGKKNRRLTVAYFRKKKEKGFSFRTAEEELMAIERETKRLKIFVFNHLRKFIREGAFPNVPVEEIKGVRL